MYPFFAGCLLSIIFALDLFGLGSMIVKELHFPIAGIVMINIITAILFILITLRIAVRQALSRYDNYEYSQLKDSSSRAATAPLNDEIGDDANQGRYINRGLFWSFLSGLLLSAIFLFDLFGIGRFLIKGLGFPIAGIIIVNIITILLFILMIIQMISPKNKIKRIDNLKPSQSNKHNPIFRWLGIDGFSEEDRQHRRDFWIVLIILSLILFPIIFSRIKSYKPKYDFTDEFPPRLFVMSPTVEIVDSMDECMRLYEQNNHTICVLEDYLDENQKQFIEQKNKEYHRLEKVYQAILEIYSLNMNHRFTQTKKQGHSIIIRNPNDLNKCINISMDKLDESIFTDQDLGIIDKKKNDYFSDIINAYFEKINVLDDPSFEEGTWQIEARDCCMAEDHNVWLQHSNQSSEGKYSLMLASANGCACVSQPFKDFSNEKAYLLTFDYMGAAPKYCMYTKNDNTCLFSAEFGTTKEWKKEYRLLEYTPKSVYTSLHLYSNSANFTLTKTYYDNIIVYISKNRNITFIQNELDTLVQKQLALKNLNACKDIFSKGKNVHMFLSLKKRWAVDKIDAPHIELDDSDLYLLSIGGLPSINIRYKSGMEYYVYLLIIVLLTLTSIYSFLKLIGSKND